MVIEALKKFRVYLIGVKFKLVADCNAFTKTLDIKDLKHRHGTKMRHVDALRIDPIMTITQDDLPTKIVRLQKQDERLSTIREILKEKLTCKDYLLKPDVLHNIVHEYELLIVPKGMQNKIIRKAHERGHFSAMRSRFNFQRIF